MTTAWRYWLAIAAWSALSVSEACAGVLQTDVIFSVYTPLSSNLELARRLLNPFEAAKLPALVAQTGKQLREQPIDLSQEKFVVYVPSTKPATGYGLVVFVPPWDRARLPPDWADVLDEDGLIFVSASNSGNDANPIARREPLALLAAANVAKLYPIDPTRVYVAGFSGGSRIAMRLALAYPDVFRGAVLNSGSDPIGNADVPLPPKDLLYQFQASSRLVYVTGDEDKYIRQTDEASRHSMESWCMFDIDVFDMPAAGHQVATASILSRALDALSRPIAPDAQALRSCRSNLEAEFGAKLAQVEQLEQAGRRDDAKALLSDINARFGGLAAPGSVVLEENLEK